MPSNSDQPDVIVVGAGLAGLVATAELTAAGRRVAVVDQEPEQSLGGQAFWSLGGLFLVDSPEQRRMRIKDSYDLAWQDWQGTAGFDRDEDHWPRRWAEAYVGWAAGEKRQWLREQGIGLMPQVGWAERGDGTAEGHGNSVPRFHLTWGVGPAVVKPFVEKLRAAQQRGLVDLRCRHRVDELVVTDGAVTGVRGIVLEPSDVDRGRPSSRTSTGEFELSAQAVIVTSGGIGGNVDLVRESWPERLGAPPAFMVQGVPDHVDGRMIGITEQAGGSVVNRDRMWHYVEGLRNWDPIWTEHGIRIIPGPSSLWLDATGKRLPPPNFPGFDTLGTLHAIKATGHDHSWFVLTQKIIEKEFALSGSEQNPDIASQSVREVLKSRLAKGAPGPVQAFVDHGADFVAATSLEELVAGMNAKTPEPLIDVAAVRRTVEARDREVANTYTKDLQIAAIRNARTYFVDKVTRVVEPHALLDPDNGPLIAVKLNLLTRKTLGGLHTDLQGRVLREADAPHADWRPVPGLYAAGEVAGFGGGGMHGYRALEGTFLGGCLFSGRTAGRAVAAQLG
ncbi:FAD-binding dehydrogenase [Patulibacter brassicae]|uniref:FAD-binding dehydrogenase n=1 Tax=Patulibacter brassicae TaxID=1705717 RepID=A0ABU4VJ56_9ACTN|nr:FAD-binding dehydrogenase [Patulibacter brassicae]MDX8151866.1 FAD-binding dehydrogenase [Patulibacter brassicae]